MRKKSRSGADLKRLNLGLTERDVERLESLGVDTNASTDTEVIRRALLTYEALVLRLKKGSEFFVRDSEDDAPVPFNLLIDVRREGSIHHLSDYSPPNPKDASNEELPKLAQK